MVCWGAVLWLRDERVLRSSVLVGYRIWQKDIRRCFGRESEFTFLDTDTMRVVVKSSSSGYKTVPKKAKKEQQ